jgi:hypothetical protein
MTCHWGFLACSELNESCAGIVVTNQQAAEVLPTGILQLIVQRAAENRRQHVRELQSKRIERIFKRLLFCEQ